MKKIFFCLSLLALATLSSCFESWDGFCVRPEGPTVTQTLQIPYFNKLTLTTDAEIYLRQGNALEVVAEGNANVISLLNDRTDNGEWVVGYSKCLLGSSGLRLYITMPNIASIRSTGSGDIIGETAIEGNNLYVNLSGSGDVYLHSLAATVDAELSGSGSLDLMGETESLNLRITGSGDISGYNFNAANADGTLTGSGHARLYVEETIRARLSGSGNFYYKGNPTILSTSTTGSGRLIDAN